MLASTLSMIAIVGVLSSKGLGTRGELAAGLGSMTLMTAIFVFQFTAFRHGLDGPLGSGYAIPVLGMGTAILFGFGRRKPNGKVVEASGQRVLVTLVLFGAALALLSLWGSREMDSEDVIQWIEESRDPDLASPMRWYEIGAAIEHLERAGMVLDLSHWTEDVHASLDRAIAGEDFNSLYALPIQRLGLERPVDLEFWRNEPGRRTLLDPTVERFAFRFDEMDLLLVEAMGGWTDPQRDLLEQQILRSLPEPDQYNALASLLGARHMLEVLHRTERIDEVAEIARRALVATWTPNNAGTEGAFPGSPELQERDDEGRLDVPRLTFVWGQSTASAVMAMDDFGVPEGVDLLQLENYLRIQSNELFGMSIDPYSALAASSLAHLRSMEEFQEQLRSKPAMSLLGLVTHYRLLLASLLLVSFAIAATLRAPVQRAQ